MHGVVKDSAKALLSATLREHGQQPSTRDFGSSGLQRNHASRSDSKGQMSKAVEAAGGMVASLQ